MPGLTARPDQGVASSQLRPAEPVVCIEHHATFTGLGDGAVDLTTTIPNTTLIGIWRIGTDNRYTLVGLSEDPLAKAAGSGGGRLRRASQRSADFPITNPVRPLGPST